MSEFNNFRKCIDVLLNDSLLLLLISSNAIFQDHLDRYQNTFKESVDELAFSGYSEQIGELAVLRMDSTVDLQERITNLSNVLHTRTSFFDWEESNLEQLIDGHIDFKVEPYKGNVKGYPTDLRALLESLDFL